MQESWLALCLRTPRKARQSQSEAWRPPPSGSGSGGGAALREGRSSAAPPAPSTAAPQTATLAPPLLPDAPGQTRLTVSCFSFPPEVRTSAELRTSVAVAASAPRARTPSVSSTPARGPDQWPAHRRSRNTATECGRLIERGRGEKWTQYSHGLWPSYPECALLPRCF